MTKIKLCGLFRPCDIDIANQLKPDYIGFVFAPKSKRYLSAQTASQLKKQLHPSIKTVGVFVEEMPSVIAELLNCDIIDLAQLHGKNASSTIRQLRTLTEKPLIQAFQIETEEEIQAANLSPADYILLDSKFSGSGTVFDWNLLSKITRPYFLAGGLTIQNVSDAVKMFHPYAVDVSSGIETDGYKDKNKMTAFVQAVNQKGR